MPYSSSVRVTTVSRSSSLRIDVRDLKRSLAPVDRHRTGQAGVIEFPFAEPHSVQDFGQNWLERLKKTRSKFASPSPCCNWL